MDEQQIPGREPQQPTPGQGQPQQPAPGPAQPSAQGQPQAQPQPQHPATGQSPFAPGLPSHPGHHPAAGQPTGQPHAAPGQPFPGQPYQGQPYAASHYQPGAGVPPVPPPTYPPTHWSGQQPWGPAPGHRPVHQPRLSHGAVAAVTAAALVLGGAAGAGAVLAVDHALNGGSGPSTAQGPVAPNAGTGDDGSSSGGSGSGSGGSGGSDGQNGFGPQWWSGNGSGGDGSSDGQAQGGASTQSTTSATAEQQRGVVTINAVLGYENAESAGTGMILTSDGYVLTNNHVVQGATSLRVTVESTGRTYEAQVVGTDAAKDVAVIRLTNASGLTAVTLDKDGGVSSGDDVTAVGNAEGQGSLVAAPGSVTATNQSMTASTDQGSTGSETLSGLIEFAAGVVSGDSGGPLLDSQGEVVGMTTAASSGRTSSTVAYAIDIKDAVAVAKRIETGQSGNGIVLGVPAFLGVAFGSQPAGGTGGSGATVQQVLQGTPAASAGIQAGDTITAVDGTAVASADALSSALATHKPGDKVTITWVSGTTGATQRASVTLMSGPAA